MAAPARGTTWAIAAPVGVASAEVVSSELSSSPDSRAPSQCQWSPWGSQPVEAVGEGGRDSVVVTVTEAVSAEPSQCHLRKLAPRVLFQCSKTYVVAVRLTANRGGRAGRQATGLLIAMVVLLTIFVVVVVVMVVFASGGSSNAGHSDGGRGSIGSRLTDVSLTVVVIAMGLAAVGLGRRRTEGVLGEGKGDETRKDGGGELHVVYLRGANSVGWESGCSVAPRGKRAKVDEAE